MADDATEPIRIKRPMKLPSDEQLDEAAKVTDDATSEAVEDWHRRSLPRWAGLVDATVKA